MTHKPLIGITISHNSLKAETSNPSTAASEYMQAVSDSGAFPEVLSSDQSPDQIEIILAELDAIVLGGGGDIDPMHYNDQTRYPLKELDRDRDHFELALVKAAIQMQKPILGICRGLQIINVALGGSLIQDIASERPEALSHDSINEHAEITHRVNLRPNSRLQTIVGLSDLTTNSYHHQAIRYLAPGLRATGRAIDGIVEAIEILNHPFGLGVQWHPERSPNDLASKVLFKSLTEAATR